MFAKRYWKKAAYTILTEPMSEGGVIRMEQAVWRARDHDRRARRSNPKFDVVMPDVDVSKDTERTYRILSMSLLITVEGARLGAVCDESFTYMLSLLDKMELCCQHIS